MILDRYLQREVLLPFIGVGAVLSALFVTFLLARLLADASAGMLQMGELLQLAGLRWLIAQEVLLPVAFFLGTILALGRLYQDSEMPVLLAAGLGEWRVWWPILRLGLLLALVVSALSLWARPWAWQQVYRIEAQAEASADIERIRAARFNEWSQGGRTVFIEAFPSEASGKALEGIFIRRRQGGNLEFISAPRGTFEAFTAPGSHKLLLEEALVYRELQDGPDLTGQFARLSLHFPAQSAAVGRYRAKTQPSGALAASTDPDDRAEWQWRLSTGITTLLLILLAFQLSRSGPREGRFLKVVVAVGIYALYYNLIGVARTWVEQGQFSGIGWVPGLLVLVILALEAHRRGLRVGGA